MPDQIPTLNPAELIAAQAERLREVARQTIRDVLDAGKPVTFADLLAVLEGAAETLPAALAAAVADQLPKIAAAAIEQAEIEIADARAESGTGYPPVNVPEVGNYTPWLVTAVGVLIASLRKRVDMVPGDAPHVPALADPGELTAEELAELDEDIRKAVDELFETMAARTVNESRMEAFRANADIVRKVKVVTVADAKRSEICAHMNGATFDPKRPVPTPPYHAGCRSYLSAITTAKRKKGATEAEIYRQNWAIYRRLEREAKAAEAAQAEGRGDVESLELRFAPADLNSDAGTFSGYAVAWGVTDNHRTAFARGSLRLPDAGLPLLWAHDPARPVGAIIEAREDDRGLFVRGKLTLGTAAGQEAHALIKDRAITGLSIGFKRLRDEAMPGGRRILAADLKEISLVTMPSNESARILEVRGAITAPDAGHPCFQNGDHQAMTTPAPASDTAATETTEVRSAVDALTKRLDKLEARSSRTGLGAGNDNAADDLERRAFNGFCRTGREALGAEEVRALRVADDPSGGYLVPPDLSKDIIRDLVEFSPVRQAAKVSNTASGNVIIPRRTGVTNARWVGETETRTASEPSFGQADIAIHELATYCDISVQLLEDAGADVEGELRTALAEDFGQKEGLAFIAGSGVKQPEGIMTNADVAAVKNGHATNLSADALIGFMYDLPATYRNRGVWMANGATIAKIRSLKDGSGAYVWRPSLAEGSPETLLGRPIVEAPDMDDVASGKHPVIFGDIARAYRIFDRVSISILRDPFSVATSGLVRFHARRRVGGAVVQAAALRKLLMSV